MKRTLKKESLTIFKAAIKAVDPYNGVYNHLKIEGERLHFDNNTLTLSSFKNFYVIGAGKASAYMALALEEMLGNRLSGGLIIVKYGHRANLKKVKIIEAGHPVPDEAGLQGAQALVKLAETFGKDDLVFCVISGGGSALLPLPVFGVNLKEKQETTKALLNCGANIHGINTLRKHLSQIKGGGLACRVYPATLISLILSDVVGNDLDIIASGPTVADKSTFSDSKKILERYHLLSKIPASVRNHIFKGAKGKKEETPKPGDPIFSKTTNIIIGSNVQCLEAAEKKAKEMGFNALILSSFMEGESLEVAKVHAAILKEIITAGRPVPIPACIISGGETTVTVRGNGKGGRNQEFALACGIEIAGWKGAAAFSAGTDGIDGPTDAAGAFTDWRMVDRAKRLRIDPYHYLELNNSYHFFEKLSDLIFTGPTRTNVMDLRLLLVR